MQKIGLELLLWRRLVLRGAGRKDKAAVKIRNPGPSTRKDFAKSRNMKVIRRDLVMFKNSGKKCRTEAV